MKKLSTDQVFAAFEDKGVQVTVKPVPGAPSLILFEGDQLAFEFLGKLFTAHSNGLGGCGCQIGPRSAGNAFFSKKAKLGVYLHRLPCNNDALKTNKQPKTRKTRSTQD